jgi:DNA-binding beta-propeller fold protein YncE
MKTSIALLLAALALAVTAGGAGANGSPYSPGLVYGGDGVLAREAGVRYVTLGTATSTLVTVIRGEGGRVERWRLLRGFYGIPLVAYDGTAGGLSGDGKRLVVGSYGPLPGNRGTTRFAVLDTKSLKLRRSIVLDGSWSFDAISPDGSTLYLTQHVTAGTNPVYRVRPFDVRTGLLRGAIVDRLEGEAEMGGEPVTRASSADGRWAYTLYARMKHEPFIHALDTEKREAFCIDLPLDMTRDEQWALRLRLLERSGSLWVRHQQATVARIDTSTFDLEENRKS